MKEANWLTSRSPKRMIEHLQGTGAAERKVRLFICACWRPRIHLMDKEMLAEVEAVEADRHHGLPQGYFPTYRDVWYAARMSSEVGIQFARHPSKQPGCTGAQQGAILRDIFGNPFRTVAFSSDWRTDTAVSLAKQMYAAREFSAMPILADALQDAGCDNEDVLSHCRDTNQVHVHGCWVCDLVLGKA